jgi:hypothetical protein
MLSDFLRADFAQGATGRAAGNNGGRKLSTRKVAVSLTWRGTHCKNFADGGNARWTFAYGHNKNFLLSNPADLWHTVGVLIAAPGRTARARMAIHVFLRLTAMDVCCGPPFTL